MKKLVFALGLWLGAMTLSHAGVSLSATRIVFSGNEKQTTIKVNNTSQDDGVFQAWLDKDNDPYQDIPFAVVPTFSKVKGGGAQILRVIAQGQGLPEDRESVFWLNVQEIPQVSSEYAEGTASGVSFTIRQRIKLFYRPASITSDPIVMTEQLQVTSASGGKQLVIKNTSPHYITLINFSKEQGQAETSILKDAIMLAPFSDTDVDLKTSVGASDLINFESMSDQGFAIPFRVKLSGSSLARPNKVAVNTP